MIHAMWPSAIMKSVEEELLAGLGFHWSGDARTFSVQTFQSSFKDHRLVAVNISRCSDKTQHLETSLEFPIVPNFPQGLTSLFELRDDRLDCSCSPVHVYTRREVRLEKGIKGFALNFELWKSQMCFVLFPRCVPSCWPKTLSLTVEPKEYLRRWPYCRHVIVEGRTRWAFGRQQRGWWLHPSGRLQGDTDGGTSSPSSLKHCFIIGLKVPKKTVTLLCHALSEQFLSKRAAMCMQTRLNVT